MTDRPILLSGRDAGRCARRIHNDWEPGSGEAIEWQPSPELQMRFEAGREFEADVFDQLKAALPARSWVDLGDSGGKRAIVEATVAAIRSNVEVILGGWLPDDVFGGRTGRPDILLRVDTDRYVPGDVKAHQMLKPRKTGEVALSTFGSPTTITMRRGYALDKSSRLGDYLQLAHYWRMLVEMGVAATDAPRGFVIGTDLPAGIDGRVLSWVDLETPTLDTYSRSEGTKKRSALERYDHEHGFRLKVAKTAASGEPALVRPIFTDECDSCVWLDHCTMIAGPNEPSAAITMGRLSVREWLALGGLGIDTVQALAELDPADPGFLADYEPEVTDRRDARRRLVAAVRRARMVRDRRVLERETTAAISLPTADIEIDFDIEWDGSQRVYLWGVLVSRAGGEPEYRAFVRWSSLSEEAEFALAHEFADWLRDEITAADTAGKTLRVYHYTQPERTFLRNVLGEDNVADLLTHFTDLHAIVKANYFGLRGLSVKQVAPAFGFHWRDKDPGGLQSQTWLATARSGQAQTDRAAARQRLLDYNEDDVRATAAIRAGIRRDAAD